MTDIPLTLPALQAAYAGGTPVAAVIGQIYARITDIKWPRKTQYSTGLDKARDYMAKSGYKNGFDVTLSISTDLSYWMEPAALLIQEAVGKIGINARVEKIPGANWRTASLVEKRLAMHLENFAGWLDTPDYYFFWAYQKGHLFNSSNYHNPEVETLTNETLHMAMDDPDYTSLTSTSTSTPARSPGPRSSAPSPPWSRLTRPAA